MFGSGLIYGINLQNACSPVSRETVLFHDENLIILIVIACLVGGSLFMLWSIKFSSFDFVDHKWLEVGWTLLPVFILISLALPSLELLYYMDSPSSITPFATLKAIGRQWYWSYEISVLSSDEVSSFSYDSYMLQEGSENDIDTDLAGFRLLEVDNPIFLPRAEYIRLLVTGGDVIHSFCIPSLGIKVDAVPGRLNQTYFFPLNLGSYYGQCSEICGANHSFMPINVEVIPTNIFLNFFN
uniref:Cytochrome c oxidase subunit 2 n=1 Tax=Discocelis tigrina TaxID=52060 RepID=A0A2R3SK47_9PLAT|nr:cytochrome c oxidase subunit II [Discocelis tigrina]AVP74410.1 cytochrome c oxidase subunit II [Discocelis tigrina]